MLDIVIVGFIALVGFIGTKKGFIKTAYQLVSFILALIISVIIYPIVSAILKLTPIYEGIKLWNVKNISSIELIGGLQSQSNTIRETTSWLPDFIVEQMVKNNNPEVYSLMHVNNLIEYISTYITDLCINAMALVIVWIIVKIGLSIAVHTLDLVAKLPLLNFTNKLAGLGLGIVKGTFIIWLVYLSVPFLIMLPQFEGLEQLLQESIVSKWLYNNNLILNYLNQMFF